jgi:hypothetical protein
VTSQLKDNGWTWAGGRWYHPLVRTRRTKAEIAELDAAIYQVAEEERPVSVRRIFYVCETRGLVPKTDKHDKVTGVESGSGTVQRRVLAMRRNRALPYSWIVDGTRYQLKPNSWDDIDAFQSDMAAMYRRNLWREQRKHLEVWVEKDAIRGVVYPVTAEYDVPVLSARGCSSESFLYATAEQIAASNAPAYIYHLGDGDPSGVVACNAIERRLRQFLPNHDLTFERLAVTEEQVAQWQLETRPTKESTHAKSLGWRGPSCELDAIPAPTLRDLVRDAIEQHIDQDQLALTKRVEREERRGLRVLLGLKRPLPWGVSPADLGLTPEEED